MGYRNPQTRKDMKAKDTVFLIWNASEGNPARMEVRHIDAMPEFGKPDGCSGTLGAMYVKWRQMPADQIMECVLWMSLEIAEGYGVPVKEVTKEMEKIEGFTEYWNHIGKRSCALF
jgi:hypothetical protein